MAIHGNAQATNMLRESVQHLARGYTNHDIDFRAKELYRIDKEISKQSFVYLLGNS